MRLKKELSTLGAWHKMCHTNIDIDVDVDIDANVTAKMLWTNVLKLIFKNNWSVLKENTNIYYQTIQNRAMLICNVNLAGLSFGASLVPNPAIRAPVFPLCALYGMSSSLVFFDTCIPGAR